ncbi:MAG: GFA family protein [Burkholderiales bacterium]
MSQITLKGSCLCGSVRYEASGDPQRFYHCHCQRCRKATGTGHASNIMMTGAKLIFTQGEGLLKHYRVPEALRFSRQFCSNCGAAVARNVPEIEAVVIPAGSLDEEPHIKPQARIFWDSRADWSCGGDDLPRHGKYPD